MVLAVVFAFTLLCAMVPCEIKLDPPEVSIGSKFYNAPRSPWGKKTLRNEYPVVFTSSGGLRGYSMGTIHGNRIHAFEGIPYGAPPIGYLRFRPPVPAPPWDRIRSAFKPGPRCLQFHLTHALQVIGKEDCLFLNIYSPNIPEPVPQQIKKHEEKAIPVVVWLHGGAFIFGAGHEYGPAYITDQNVILVTINSRLGVLGFLSTGDEASPGNYGLKDQALALKWIHENIHHFGGDPEKVTLMGQSAGGTSVHLHMVANKTREYFRSGVSLSSSGFQHWALQSPSAAKFWTNWLADVVKCPRTTKSSHALVECFRDRNPAFLVAKTIHLFKWLVFPPVLFAPVVEFNHPGAFLVDTVENHYKRGDVARKPWISTLTSEEGYLAIYNLLQQMKYFRRHFDEFQSFVYDYDHIVNASTTDIVGQKIRDFYFGSESPETVPASKIAQIMTDRYFVNGQIRSIRKHSKIAPTYSYLFDFKGRSNTGKASGARKEDWGVGHAEDVFYFLNATGYYDGMKKNTPDYKLSQTMLNFLGNFVHKSVPFYSAANGTDINYWEAQKPEEEVRLLYLGNSGVKMINNPFTERLKFWENLGLSDVEND